MICKVFSGRAHVLEAGYEPNLEAVFHNLKKAEDFLELWKDVYKGEIEFWIEAE